MSSTVQPREIPDLGPYAKNRPNFPLDELAKYAGRQVAFNLDGTRIVASADDWGGLESELKRLGIDLGEVVFSYVHPLEGHPPE
ncbi:MAG: hypothetical protein KY476_08360 [Planctomycetes bacterium]|nr:hypothetical protein [Planctomycetota bacterium]